MAWVRPSDELIRKRRIARRGKKNLGFGDWRSHGRIFGKGGFFFLYWHEYINAYGNDVFRWDKGNAPWDVYRNGVKKLGTGNGL